MSDACQPRPGGIWNACFNWPDVVNFLVLVGCFVFTWHKANASTSASAGKGKILIFVLVLALVLMLRQGRFHGEIRAVMLALALVLASPVKTRLKRYHSKTDLTAFFVIFSRAALKDTLTIKNRGVSSCTP